MLVVYKFRVTFEDYDEVIRDIEIKSIQTFEDFHYIIQSSINFDATKSASFFMSSDLWIKDQEIVLEEKLSKSGEKLPLMKDARLCDFIADPHQKIIYISDYDANWTFFIELLKIIPQGDPGKNYPVCVKSVGDAPKQYTIVNPAKIKISPEDSLSGLLAMVEDEEEIDEVDDIKDDLMEESEEGVELDEISGMGEEGEDDEEKEEDEEGSLSDMDEDQKDDY